MFTFRRIVTVTFSVATAIGVLFQSSPSYAQTTPTGAPIIANADIPEIIWHLVPNAGDQAKVILDGAAEGGSKWQGGYLLSTTDGSKVTFRLQVGGGKYRFEYDDRPGVTDVMMYYPAPVCVQSRIQRNWIDPRDRNANLRAFTCDGPNTVELKTNQIWYYPAPE